jgi:hypothetical protein
MEVTRMRIFKAVQLSFCAVMLCAMLGTSLKADQWDKKTIVTFSDSVEIPGQVLPPGTYTFKLLNSDSERHIVQVWSADETQLFATIMAIPAYRLHPNDKTIFEFDERPANSPEALHTWFYPGDNFGIEFVYNEHKY